MHAPERHSLTLFPLLLILLALAFAPTDLQAQTFGRLEQIDTNVGAYFHYVIPGSPSVQVHVIGTVAAPGLYELNAGTDLGHLLSLAGGPLLAPRLNNRSRDVRLRLISPSTGGNAPVFDRKLEEAALDPSGYPVLQDGDVLYVEVVEKESFGWRDGLTVVSTVGVLALTVLRVAYGY